MSIPMLSPNKLISQGNMSGNLTSDVRMLSRPEKNASVSLFWMGSSPVGVISIEYSTDYAEDGNGNVTNAGTWTHLVGNDQNISGSNGKMNFEVNKTGTFAMRVKYTRTSGSGILQAFLHN